MFLIRPPRVPLWCSCKWAKERSAPSILDINQTRKNKNRKKDTHEKKNLFSNFLANYSREKRSAISLLRDKKRQEEEEEKKPPPESQLIDGGGWQEEPRPGAQVCGGR